MGCDIHAVVDVYENGNWVGIESNIADTPRHYDFFGAIAGVRSGITCLIQPRGLPGNFKVDNDFKTLNKYYDEKEDDSDFYFIGEHSHSYLLLSELIDLRNFHAGNIEIYYDDDTNEPSEVSPEAAVVKTLSKYISHLSRIKIEQEIDNNENIRLVFGFDS